MSEKIILFVKRSILLYIIETEAALQTSAWNDPPRSRGGRGMGGGREVRHRNKSRTWIRALAIVCLVLSSSIRTPASGAGGPEGAAILPGEGGSRFYVDSIEWSSHLFGYKHTEFTPTTSLQLLQEYFTANFVRSGMAHVGPKLELLQEYFESRLPASMTTAARADLLLGWLDSEEMEKEFLDACRKERTKEGAGAEGAFYYRDTEKKEAPARAGAPSSGTTSASAAALPSSTSTTAASAERLAKERLMMLRAAGSIFVRTLRLARTSQKSEQLEIAAGIVAEWETLRKRWGGWSWGTFVGALAQQAFETLSIKPDLGERSLALLSRASMEETSDPQLHYVIGILYMQHLPPKDVGTYTKMVTSEFEKTLMLSSANKELFVHITGLYATIHGWYGRRRIQEPFWFEELVYKRIIALDPTNAQAHNNLAYLYASAGVNLKQALIEAQIARQLDPGNPSILDTLGWAYYRNGKLKEALSALRKALSKAGDDAEIHYHLATVYYELKQYDRVEYHYRKTIELDPSNHSAKNNLAYLYAERNVNLEGALQLADEAIAAVPDSAAYLDTKGWVLYRLGRYEEAAAFIRKALAADPDSPDLHLHLGEVYLALKKLDQAVRQFELALKYKPDDGAVARRLAAIMALKSLRESLKHFSRISGVQRHRESMRLFYDLMADIYREQNEYDKAIAVLKEYERLRSGVPLSKLGAEELENVRTASIRRMLKMLPSHIHYNLLVDLEKELGLKIVQILARERHVASDMASLMGFMGDRLPERVMVAVSLVRGAATDARRTITVIGELPSGTNVVEMFRQLRTYISTTTEVSPAGRKTTKRNSTEREAIHRAGKFQGMAFSLEKAGGVEVVRARLFGQTIYMRAIDESHVAAALDTNLLLAIGTPAGKEEARGGFFDEAFERILGEAPDVFDMFVYLEPRRMGLEQYPPPLVPPGAIRTLKGCGFYYTIVPQAVVTLLERSMFMMDPRAEGGPKGFEDSLVRLLAACRDKCGIRMSWNIRFPSPDLLECETRYYEGVKLGRLLFSLFEKMVKRETAPEADAGASGDGATRGGSGKKEDGKRTPSGIGGENGKGDGK